MKLQQLMSYTRRAIDDYGMIQSGDKIAIGQSVIFCGQFNTCLSVSLPAPAFALV